MQINKQYEAEINLKDVFFELGDYVYNVHVGQKTATDAEKKAEKILNNK